MPSDKVVLPASTWANMPRTVFFIARSSFVRSSFIYYRIRKRPVSKLAKPKCPRSLLLSPEGRVSNVTQSIPQKVETKDGENNGKTWIERQMRRGANGFPAQGQHAPPADHRRLRPQPKEAQGRFCRNCRSHV